MLTDKGEYVLDCINSGINVSLKEFDEMWAQFNTGSGRTKCEACHGTGFVVAQSKEGGSDANP